MGAWASYVWQFTCAKTSCSVWLHIGVTLHMRVCLALHVCFRQQSNRSLGKPRMAFVNGPNFLAWSATCPAAMHCRPRQLRARMPLVWHKHATVWLGLQRLQDCQAQGFFSWIQQTKNLAGVAYVLFFRNAICAPCAGAAYHVPCCFVMACCASGSHSLG
jgi:hypothetical protein